MEAELKQMNLKPATFDKEGNLVNEEYASITLNVSLYSEEQREAVEDLFDLLGDQSCYLSIASKQIKAKFEETA